MKVEHEVKLRKIEEEKRIKKEKEMEEMGEKTRILRKNGMCRVKFYTYVVEFKNPYTGKRELRMNHLDSYMESYLQTSADDLKDSPLIEELEARVEILVALANIKAAEEAKRKKAYDEQFENFSEYGAKLRQENCL